MVRLTGRSVCSKKVIKDFWGVHFSCLMIEKRVVNSYTNGFSGNLCAVLVCYLEVGDAASGMVVGNAFFVN